MGTSKTYCEKCKKRIYPVSYRNEDKYWIPIKMKAMGKYLKRVYWCKKCKMFYRRNS